MVLPFFCVFATFGFLSLPAWFNCSLLLLPPPTNQPTNPNYYYYYYYHHLIPGVHLSVLVVCWYRYTIPGLVITYSKFLFFPFLRLCWGRSFLSFQNILLPNFSPFFMKHFISLTSGGVMRGSTTYSFLAFLPFLCSLFMSRCVLRRNTFWDVVTYFARMLIFFCPFFAPFFLSK